MLVKEGIPIALTANPLGMGGRLAPPSTASCRTWSSSIRRSHPPDWRQRYRARDRPQSVPGTPGEAHECHAKDVADTEPSHCRHDSRLRFLAAFNQPELEATIQRYNGIINEESAKRGLTVVDVFPLTKAFDRAITLTTVSIFRRRVCQNSGGSVSDRQGHAGASQPAADID